MKWLDGITSLMNMSLTKLWELEKETPNRGKPGVLQSKGVQTVTHN